MKNPRWSGLGSLAKVLLALAGSLALLGCEPAKVKPASQDADWPGVGNTPSEQRFVPLDQINSSNVYRLGLAWSLDLEDETALEATPIEVGGVLYFSGGFATVYAVDARKGNLLWKYDPHSNEAAPRWLRSGYGVNRGVAYWEGKVFVATKDCRMIAIDAKTGRPVWSSSFMVPGSKSSSSGAPRVFNGKVIIGNSGADMGARGYVTAFDAKTGKLAWRFFTVPGDPVKGFENEAMAMAAKTWSGEWWKYGGGGTPWNAITFDPEFNQILIGTGNGGPWNASFRGANEKDNLFLSSIVAVDANTGKYKWHYQTNPGEVWDYKATADIVLTVLNIEGKPRKVLMQAPTNGFFYVIDRRDGKLISAEKIGKVTWAERIDLKTGRPMERPGARYQNEPFVMYPSAYGAHNWQAMSYNPVTGLVYVPIMQLGQKFGPVPFPKDVPEIGSSRIEAQTGVPSAGYLDPNDPNDGRGSLVAWDPIARKARWKVDYPSYLNAGTVTTAGNLVFQGTDQGQLYAYAADNGKRLWSFDAKLGIISPPISYSVGGKQYVTLLVGFGGIGGQSSKKGWKYGLQPRRVLTFALDGRAKLPKTAPPDFTISPLDDNKIKLDPKRVKAGAGVYYKMVCFICHGLGLKGSGNAPDLRESPIAFNREAFATLLRTGPLIPRGMPLYDDLTGDEIENLYHYIRQSARDAKEGRGEEPAKRGGF
jgi:quinohemoprotein ethanol dehydrogenase